MQVLSQDVRRCWDKGQQRSMFKRTCKPVQVSATSRNRHYGDDRLLCCHSGVPCSSAVVALQPERGPIGSNHAPCISPYFLSFQPKLVGNSISWAWLGSSGKLGRGDGCSPTSATLGNSFGSWSAWKQAIPQCRRHHLQQVRQPKVAPGTPLQHMQLVCYVDGPPLQFLWYLHWFPQHALLHCVAQLWHCLSLDPKHTDAAQTLSRRFAAELAVVFVGSMVPLLGIAVSEAQLHFAVLRCADSCRFPFECHDSQI